MSIFTVEKVLFDIVSTPDMVAKYKAAPDAFLDGYPLEADERKLILELDVFVLVQRSINPMLMSRVFAALRGREHMPEYRQRLKGA